jgi:uncharacterized membrane protein YhhN
MWGEYQGPDILIYIFKPLTMIFIITIAVLAKEPPSRKYMYAIIAGLLFSLMGDIPSGRGDRCGSISWRCCPSQHME